MMHSLAWCAVAIFVVWRLVVMYGNWKHNQIMKVCIERLEKRLKKLDVCPSHGINHARAVLKNAYVIMSDMTMPDGSYIWLSWTNRLVVALAALLHDADDRKIPGYTKGLYPNALSIMHDIPLHIRNTVIVLIKLTSASSNGDHISDNAKKHPWMLIPRYADRLEAIGRIGLERCYVYTVGIKRPLYTDKTMRAKNIEDLKTRVAPKSRWENYVKNDGKSESMMDHIYDKLLHLFSEPMPFDSKKFNQRIRYRENVLVNVALNFGHTGHISAEDVEEAVRGRRKSIA